MFIMWKIERGDLLSQIANVAATYQDRFGAFPTAIYAHANDRLNVDRAAPALCVVSTPTNGQGLGAIQPGIIWVGIAPQAVRA